MLPHSYQIFPIFHRSGLDVNWARWRTAVARTQMRLRRDRFMMILRPFVVRHKFCDDVIILGGSPATAVHFSSRPATPCSRDLTG